jgi:hypothetical protein
VRRVYRAASADFKKNPGKIADFFGADVRFIRVGSRVFETTSVRGSSLVHAWLAREVSARGRGEMSRQVRKTALRVQSSGVQYG